MHINIVENRLELTVSPPYDAAVTTALLERASTDPRLPDRFGLLIDTRAVNIDMSLADIVARVENLVRIFGTRLAAVVTVPADDERTSPTHLKVAAGERSIAAAIFHNVDAARLWLAAAVHDSPNVRNI